MQVVIDNNNGQSARDSATHAWGVRKTARLALCQVCPLARNRMSSQHSKSFQRRKPFLPDGTFSLLRICLFPQYFLFCTAISRLVITGFSNCGLMKMNDPAVSEIQSHLHISKRWVRLVGLHPVQSIQPDVSTINTVT